MKIIDILEGIPPLTSAISPQLPISSPPTSTPGAYGAMVRQAVAAPPAPEKPYQGLGQLTASTAEPPAENRPMPMGAQLEAAEWTMTFGDFLALHEAERV